MSTNNLFVKKEESADTSTTTSLPISNIELNKVRIMIEDTVIADSRFDFTFTRSEMHIAAVDSGYQFETEDNIFVKTLTFRIERGGCFENTGIKSKLKIQWNPDAKLITFLPSTLTVKESSIFLKGTVLNDSLPQVNLLFNAPKTSMPEAVKLVSNYTREKLEGYNFTEPINATLTLTGEMIPNIPLDIDLFFRTVKNQFTTPKQTFEEVTLKGHYTNHLSPWLVKNEANSGLTLVGFKGKFETIPFDINLHVLNLIDPYLYMHLRSDVDLKGVNNAVDTALIQFDDGSINVDVTFKGHTSHDHVAAEADSGATLTGIAEIKDAGYTITKRNYVFSDITGKIIFDRYNIYFAGIPVNINKNQTNVSASFGNFVNSLMQAEEAFTANITITCPKFDLANFSTPADADATKKPDEKKRLNKLIENLITNLDANITMNADQVVRNKLVLSNVSANVNMHNDDIYIQQANFNSAGGKVNLSGRLTDIGTNHTAFQLSTNISNADITQLFAELNNFNQTVVTSKNLSGLLDAKMTVSSGLTKKFTIRQESIAGTFEVKIKKGELHNLKALDEITGNILKNKEFSNMQFATLNHNSTLKGQDFTIEQMEIQSNVITLFVNGVYSFGDNTELFVKVPISSLKNQDPDYVAKNKSPDEKIGLSLNFKIKKEWRNESDACFIFQKKSN
ncbi:MAG: AsmA family protein [Bacteroidetes bacterium]|nr:AsmA family protein [Bacteroidota bacterium]